MRTTIAVLTALLMLALTALAAPVNTTGQTAAVAGSPDDLLRQGQDDYRAGRYTQAVTELQAASEAFLTPEQMRTYVNTGKFETLPRFETSIIYLALAYAKLGRDADASEQIHRLTVAEGIEPSYARLPLTADVADFEQVVARVAPATKLPPNTALASLRTSTPPVQIAQQPTRPAPQPPTIVVAPVPVTPTPVPATQPSTATAVVQVPPSQKLPVQPTIPEDRAAQQRIIEQRVAEERAAIQREADRRVASAQAEAQRTIEERVATERAAIERAAQERIASERAAAQAAAQRDADQRIAAAKAQAEREAQEKIAAQRTAEQRIAEVKAASDRAAQERIAADRAAAQRAADERVARERAALEQQTAERVAAARAAAEREAAARVAAAERESQGNELAQLRRADVLATHSNTQEANTIYLRLANGANSRRDTIAAAATGLYRIGDFTNAVRAFQRLGTFLRGEEDLRYYNAVALYETGHYDQAKKELACALPYIQITEDVARYREKIEQTAGQQAMR